MVACASGGVDLSMMEKGGREGKVPGEMQINQVPKSLLSINITFTYAYSHGCQSVVKSLCVPAQTLVKV